jgi:hypothetical protein
MDSRQPLCEFPIGREQAGHALLPLAIAWDTKVRAPGGNAEETPEASISTQLETRDGQEAASTQLTRVTGVMIP